MRKKKLLTIICCFVLTAWVVIFIGCSDDPIKLKDEVSTLTINLVSIEDDVDIEAGAIITLTDNNDSKNEYEVIATESSVIFEDIPFGIYTLKVNHYDFEDYTYESFTIQSIEVSHTAILTKLDNDISTVTINLVVVEGKVDIVAGAIVTLTNNSDSQHEYTVFTTESPVVFQNVPYGVYTLKVEPNELYEEYIFETLDIHSIRSHHNAMLFLFPEVKKPSDLYDFNRFYIHMQVHSIENLTAPRIFIEHRLGGNLRLEIDGEPISLYPTDNLPFILEGYFEFVSGQTYQFRLTYIRDGLLREEVFNFMMPQEVIPEWPEFIDDEQIDISWKLHPDNNQNHDFNYFSIYKATLLNYNEMLLPTQRSHIIPAGLIPFPSVGHVRISLSQQNYAISGHVAVVSHSVGAGASYINGGLNSWTNLPSMTIDQTKK